MRLRSPGALAVRRGSTIQANGCATMQGYLYHRPIALGSFIGVLQEQNRLIVDAAPALSQTLAIEA